MTYANNGAEDGANQIVTALLDAVHQLSADDGAAVFTLNVWLSGVPSSRLLAVLRSTQVWGIAQALIRQEIGFRKDAAGRLAPSS